MVIVSCIVELSRCGSSSSRLLLLDEDVCDDDDRESKQAVAAMPEVAYNAAIIGAGYAFLDDATPPLPLLLLLLAVVVVDSSMGNFPATLRINSSND